MPDFNHEARRARLAEACQKAGVKAVVTASVNPVRYACGLTEGGAERLIAAIIGASGEWRLVCPALSSERAQEETGGSPLAWSDADGHQDALSHALEAVGVAKGDKVAVDGAMRADHLLSLQELGMAAVDGTEVLSSVMSVKDTAEIEALQKAAHIADEAFAEVAGGIQPGITERDLADRLLAAMERRGGQPTFAIVASGANGAKPHHEPGDKKLTAGDVVIMDFGCSIHGYQSDITRTVSIGEPSDPDADKVYQLVRQAHLAGRGAAVAGAAYGKADHEARSVIEQAGFGEFFNHRLGHGIGLSIHEKPDVVSGSDVTIQAGSTFSIEPGIYLPGRFGVRLENIVMASESGCESLNAEFSDILPRL